MTKIEQLKLQKRILEIVQNETVWNLYCHIECCQCGLGCEKEYIGFYVSQIAPFIYKKLGYKISKDIIKHALAPIKKDNYFLKTT
jgi:hypothetical protein